MKAMIVWAWALILCGATVPVQCDYHSETVPHVPLKEKKTELHFFIHDILSGDKPSAVLVARANVTHGGTNPTPFGTVFVIDDPLTVGPEPTSKVIGNARGTYVTASQDGEVLTLVLAVDLGFTAGKFNGSSISVFSRLPLSASEPVHEMAVVGGRGKFRLARGFVEDKPYYFNATTGDAISEYKVTVFHPY